MVISEIQQSLFAHIKEGLPKHLSLVDQLCDLLDLSSDSVYRRIRGEKPVSLSELKLICTKYNLSLDQLLQLQTDTVVFKASDLHKKVFPFKDVLGNMVKQFTYMNSFQEKQIWYLCKDMPFWTFFLYPELGAFKSFFWAKTIHNDPEFQGKQFSLNEFTSGEFISMGKQINTLYNQMPGVELWNAESINSTISQIKFYIESGVFKNKEDIEGVIIAFDKTIDHIGKQAEAGYKFEPGASDLSYKATHQLYVNEVVIGSNTILAALNDSKVAYIPYNVFSFLHTSDDTFCESILHGIDTLRSKSALISGTGEKDRNKFINSLKQRVHALRLYC